MPLKRGDRPRGGWDWSFFYFNHGMCKLICSNDQAGKTIKISWCWYVKLRVHFDTLIFFYKNSLVSFQHNIFFSVISEKFQKISVNFV